jgi:ketosteroid isomerase-like protein
VLASDSSDVVATLSRFHSSLAAGDSATALTLLSPDLQVLESGGIESLADYRAHHLAADIEFARAVPSARKLVRVTVKGDVAWIVSESTTQGQSGGRTINSVGAELAVLRRETTGWRIAAIHWSSRNRRTAPPE